MDRTTRTDKDKGRRRLFKHRGNGEQVEAIRNKGKTIRPVTHEGRASDLKREGKGEYNIKQEVLEHKNTEHERN